MSIKVPFAVPRRYATDGEHYGVNGTIEALHNAALADEWEALMTKRHTLCRDVRSGSARHYADRAKAYRKLAIEWRACALNTMLAARARLNLEAKSRRAHERLDEAWHQKLEDQRLVCSPASIQKAMKE